MKHLVFILFIFFYLFSFSQEITEDKLEEGDDLIMYLKGDKKPYTGTCISYYEDGQKGKEGAYKNGKMTGLWVWYYNDKQKKRETYYLNGKKNGKCIYWYKNGQKKSESIYKDDILIGKYTWWFENGKKKKYTVYDEKGIFVGTIKWDEAGTIIENSFKK